MKIHEIASAHNGKYKTWLSLLESKGIRKQGLCLVSGMKLIKELSEQRADDMADLILPPKWNAEELPDSLKRVGRLARLSAPLFKALDSVGTRSPLAVLRVPALAPWRPDEPPAGLELILALSDPANLGACLRSAEAFGVRRVILTSESASPFLPRAVRAASGSNFRLPLAFTTASIHHLNATDGAAALLKGGVGLDMEGVSLRDFNWPRDVYLILGEEGQGLPPGLAETCVRIPMRPPVESLNATVAAAVAMFSYRQTHVG